MEFDLEAMMNGEVYADFVLLWLLCHQSRVEAERPEECWLEKWSHTAQEQGTRALEQLRSGVERAITALGSGLLAHPANNALREHLRSGQLNQQDYYRQLLRLVYRLIVLFVAEDRDILFHPSADLLARERYAQYYSTARLRRLAEQRVGTRHIDLYHSLRLVMEKLGHERGCPELGLPALDSFLFSQAAIADLEGYEIANHDLLDAIRSLAFTNDRHTRRAIDYKNLGAEELGSVYESLLELHPVLHIEAAKFELQTTGGNERKTTGSYYTPTRLIICLLDSALDPVLDEASAQPDPEQAILDLKVCDPACGSGHFLIAAAHRIARRLAAIRTGEEESGLEARRKALRDVVGRCLYGVDINPMAVELCKVSLWMEAIEPGKPFSFLDQHIQCGNSLLGTTPALLREGIPDSAFEAIEGDDKKVCSEYRKKNKLQREGNRTLFDPEGKPWERLGDLATSIMQLDQMGDDTIEEVRREQEYYNKLIQSNDYLFGRLWADARCAAFVWKKTNDFAYPITEEVFRNIEKNNISTWMRDEIIRLREQYQFFHWHLAFPDVFRVPTKGEMLENEQTGWSRGFDVVLGNPPWEHTELKEQEWFAIHKPEIANTVGAGRKRQIAALATTDPELFAAFIDAKRQQNASSHFIRNSNHYPLCGRGRINTYAIFAEIMRAVIGSRGRVGCIVPSGIATDEPTKLFIQDLTESQSLVSFFSFINEAKLFPGIDHRVSFALLTISGATVKFKEADLVVGAYRTDDLNEKERHCSLSAKDIALLNPNTHTCPIFRSKRDMTLTQAIYQRVPVLIKDGPPVENPWNISVKRMFDMTAASHLFRTREQLEAAEWRLVGNVFHREDEQYLPLYEGKMVWHFDHRFGTYEGQTEAQARQNKLPELRDKEHTDPFLFSLPKYWIHESHMPDLMKDGRNAFLAFRDITNAVVLRTAIFSIIPALPCGNNLPIALIDAKYTREIIFLAASTSSFVLDYVTRQKLGGTHMNSFIFHQLPILSPGVYATTCEWDTECSIGDWMFPRALELTYTAWDLEPFAKECGYGGPPFCWNRERRFLLRCELDAAYFHLYGIERDDVDYIMGTFRVMKEADEKQYGEHRTKRVILEIYDEMQRAMETGESYRTRLEPPPADPAVAHEPREMANIQ